jgi:predicted metal-dependent hydrolase
MTIHVDPIRRNVKFGLFQDKVLDWNPDGLHVTQFFNTLSIFFPAGERFFIQSVRNYRDEITDAKLKEQISAFIGQEGFHTREHEAYNAALVAAGMPLETLDAIVVQTLELVKKLPRSFQLAVTVALEHLTAVLGDMLLSNEQLLDGADPRYAAIWKWHAIEETEHKAVCFDAYEQVVGRGVNAYAQRTLAFVLANAIFWSLFLPFYAAMLRRSGGLTQIGGWLKLANILAGKPGIMRRVLPDWADFFRPTFHPWMHDNRQFLEKAQALTEQIAAFHAASAAPAMAPAAASAAASAKKSNATAKANATAKTKATATTKATAKANANAPHAAATPAAASTTKSPRPAAH